MISKDPKFLSGTPRLNGHRISVVQILAEIADRGNIDSVSEDFGIEKQKILDMLRDLSGILDRNDDWCPNDR